MTETRYTHGDFPKQTFKDEKTTVPLLEAGRNVTIRIYVYNNTYTSADLYSCCIADKLRSLAARNLNQLKILTHSEKMRPE